MQIAILNFPVNDVGGINSWIENFQVGARALGHKCDLFYVTGQGRFGIEIDKKLTKARCSILAGEHLSMKNGPEFALDTLGHYDLIVFGHTSPHPTKVNLQGINTDWMALYETEHPKITVFHDDRWRKNNYWLEDLDPQGRTLAVAAQHKFLEATNDWAGRINAASCWEYFPLQVPTEYIRANPRHYGIIFTQWVGMKNHRKFLPVLPEMPDPIHFYGNGVEYTYARRDGDLDYYNIEDVTEFGKYHDDAHVFFGFVPYEDILDALRHAKYAIDLSANGYTNMSHWEPLMYGVPSFVHADTMNDPTCELPSEGCVVYEDFNDLPRAIENHLDGLDSRAAYEFVRDNCSCEKVVRRLIEKVM